jgi:hypothetical protein
VPTWNLRLAWFANIGLVDIATGAVTGVN